MHRMCLFTAAVLGFGAVAVAAEEPNARPEAAQPATPATNNSVATAAIPSHQRRCGAA